MRTIARLFGALGAIAILGLTPAWGVTKTWNASSNGDFHDPLRWTPTGAPTSTDVAEFERGKAATYTVTFPEDVGKAGRRTDRLVVGANNVTFAQGKAGDSTYEILNATTTPAGRGIVIGEQSGDVAGLTTSLTSLTAVAATIGDAAGSSGGLTVASGAVEFIAASADEPLIVGNYGAGELTVADGASLTAAKVVVGKEAGSSGVVTVDGGTLNGFIDMSSGLGAKTLTLNGITKATSLHVIGADAVANINGSLLDGGQLGSITAGNGGRINQVGGTLRNGNLTTTFNDGHLLMSGSARYESSAVVSLEGASTLEAGSNARLIALGVNVGIDATLSGNGRIETNPVHYLGLNNQGRLAPGVDGGAGVGRLTVVGDFTQQSSGRMEMGIGQGLSDPIYDSVFFSGSAHSAVILGTIEVILLDGFEPLGGQSFDLFDFSGTGGVGATLVLPELKFGRQWDASNLSETGILSVVGVGELPADFQNDDDVDGDDLTLWRLGFGTTGAPSQAQGNADGDQDVDGQDLLYWQQQYGSGVAVAAAGDVVPEPPASVLVAAGALLAMRRRGLTA